MGEHFIDLRDLEYLFAATDDDAYNALVCTRFAPAMGRERVHQPPPAGERELLLTSRDWRGKYSPHAALSHARLSELIGDGFGFVMHQREEHSQHRGGERWPVIAVSPGGALSFFSPDQEIPPAEEHRVVWFERIGPAERRRRFAWPRKSAKMPDAKRQQTSGVG